MTLDDTIDELETSINESEIKHAVRELFQKTDSKQIPLKTEISDDEIKMITRLKTIGAVMRINTLSETLDNFMLLRISNARKGRQEIIDALKQIADNKTGARAFGMLGKLPQGIGGMI